ncbi:MAG: uracil-DNA glycosylase [Phototrophicaceae bacterium]
MSACQRCSLHSGRTRTVPGAGNPHAEIMFIGEAPGQREDEQGIPFVGRSGEYLNYLLNLIQLERQSVFITNVVKCRPPDNRDPETTEIEACRSYLDSQIEVINPSVIVTVGRFSMARYFPKAKITQIHGQPKYEDKRAYYPIYHPAAALRNPSLRRDMEVDIKRLVEVIAEVKRLRNVEIASNAADQEPPQQLTLF